MPSEKILFDHKRDRLNELAWRWEIQQALHANLNVYSVLVAYAAISPRSLPQLFKGFGKQLDTYK